MEIRVDHYHHTTPDSSGAILTLLHTILTEIRTMASDIDRANAALASIAQNQQDEATENAAALAAITPAPPPAS